VLCNNARALVLHVLRVLRVLRVIRCLSISSVPHNAILKLYNTTHISTGTIRPRTQAVYQTPIRHRLVS